MNPGNIVLVKFPFTDLRSEKKRPALVLCQTTLSPRMQLVTIAMITSKTEGQTLSGDVTLKDWKQAGLLHPSVVRLAKTATVETEIIEKSLGALQSEDLEQVKETFQSFYTFWLSTVA